MWNYSLVWIENGKTTTRGAWYTSYRDMIEDEQSHDYLFDKPVLRIRWKMKDGVICL